MIAKLKMMEVIFYSPPKHEEFFIETTCQSQIFKTTIFKLEDQKYLRLRKLNCFQLGISSYMSQDEHVKTTVYPFQAPQDIYWTKIELRQIMKLQLNHVKYFSFPLFHQNGLAGQLKIKISLHTHESASSFSQPVQKGTLATYMKPILSNEILISQEHFLNRNSFEECQEDLLQKFEMINKKYNQKGNHHEAVWEQPDEDQRISFEVILEERQSELSHD